MLVRGLTNILPGGGNGKHSAAYRLSACEGENLVREHLKKKRDPGGGSGLHNPGQVRNRQRTCDC